MAPATESDTLATIGVFPTILELADVSVNDGRHIDGESFAPLLLRHQAMPNRRLFWMQGSNKAVREGDWKLTIVNGYTSLDVRRDLAEKSDVAASNPAVVEAMSSALGTWTVDVTAALH